MSAPKTYKREVAVMLLSFWIYLCIRAAGDPVVLETAKLATAPIFIFALGAFGLDAAAKQFGGKP